MNKQKILRGLVNDREGIRQNDFVTQGEKGAYSRNINGGNDCLLKSAI